jgi:membrane peptidoglycan carboxypeptidase
MNSNLTQGQYKVGMPIIIFSTKPLISDSFQLFQFCTLVCRSISLYKPSVNQKIKVIAVIILNLLFISTLSAGNPLEQWEKLKLTSFQKIDLLLYKITNGMATNTSFIPQQPPTRIYDRKGKLIAEYLPARNLLVPLSEITNNLTDAVIAVEDSEFYRHNGINLKGIARAAYRNIRSFRVVQGGSTLSQQLAKIVFTSGKRTISRKLIDTVAALDIEKRYTKQQILVLYLSLAYFGHGLYGIETASHFYFNKSAHSLDLAESAGLAGLLSSPNSYSPFRNPELFRKRQKTALDRMAKTGLIPSAEVTGLIDEFWTRYGPILGRQSFSMLPVRINRSGYITDFIIQSLPWEYRNNENSYDIHTTFDLELQSCVQSNVGNYMSRTFSKTDTIQVAAMLMDPDSGEVRAMVGGKEYSRADQLNRALQSRRQIGSVIKPFLYATAMEYDSRLNPYSLVTDLPVKIRISKKQIWRPSNFDHKYDGLITLEDAIRKSKNTVAVRLLRDLGVKNFAGKISSVWGTNTFANRSPGMSLALGSLELTPCQVAEGFAVIANTGTRITKRFILEIKTNLPADTTSNYSAPELGTIQPEITNFQSIESSLALNIENEFVSDDLPVSQSNELGISDITLNAPNTNLTTATDLLPALSESTERPSITLSIQAEIPQYSVDRIFSVSICSQVTGMLIGVARPGGTAWGAARQAGITNGVACKTGTTSDEHDAWFAVYSVDYVLIIWLGYDKGNRSLPMGGPGLAAPLGLKIWKDLLFAE